MSGVAIFGPGGLVMFANVQLSKCSAALGLRPRIGGQSFHEVYPGNVRKEILSVIDRSAETGKPAADTDDLAANRSTPGCSRSWAGRTRRRRSAEVAGDQVLAINRKVQGTRTPGPLPRHGSKSTTRT